MRLDPTLAWTGVIGLSVFLYGCLDGFDLGIGMLLPLGGSRAGRERMIAAMPGPWDGAEAWLLMAAAGMLAAFPVAFANLVREFFAPLLLMVLALVARALALGLGGGGSSLRGAIRTGVIFAGSVIAALAQGLVLGRLVQGAGMRSGALAGGPGAWATPFAWAVAAGLVAGYILLGSTWLMGTISGRLKAKARRWSAGAIFLAAVLLGAVSLHTVGVHPEVGARWGFLDDGIRLALLAPRLPIPILGATGFAVAALGVRAGSRLLPYLGGLIVYVSVALGIAVSLLPFLAPYAASMRPLATSSAGRPTATVATLLALIFVYTLAAHLRFAAKEFGDG